MVTSRIWFTAKQKGELWERWKNGQSVLAISRALERRNKTGVHDDDHRHLKREIKSRRAIVL